MDLGIKDKVFMVAGASSGLGYAIAHKLAGEGAKVSLGSRSERNIAGAAATISQETTAEVRGYVFDARDSHSITRWVEQTQKDFHRLDGIVINAGGPTPGFFDEFDDTAWESAFELTLLSAVRMIRASLPALKQHGGSILALTSSAVKEPIDILLLSNIMRSGVASLVKSLSGELAKDNIRINNLIPGLIDTNRIEALNLYLANRTDTNPEQIQRNAKANIPMGRYGKPEEFANAAAFLLSDAASYISGTSMVVDGGKMKSL